MGDVSGIGNISNTPETVLMTALVLHTRVAGDWVLQVEVHCLPEVGEGILDCGALAGDVSID